MTRFIIPYRIIILAMVLVASIGASADDSYIGEGTSGTCHWYITKGERKLVVEPTDGYAGTLDTWGNDNAPWYSLRDTILTAQIKSGVTALTCNSFFSGCKKMTSTDLSGLNTESVTDMHCMFEDCTSLTSVDITNLNTQNVSSMGMMFADCSALTSLDISTLNTQNVTDMRGMFFGCSALTNIDFGNISTQNVQNTSWMFAHCKALTTLSLGSFNTQSVTDMEHMFYDCPALENIDLGNSFNTQNVTDMNSMFFRCSNLKDIDVKDLATQNVTDMDMMFAACPLTALNVSHFNASKVTSNRQMFDWMPDIKSISTPSTMTTADSAMFANCPNLREIIWNSPTAVIPDDALTGTDTSGNFFLFVPEGYTGKSYGNTVKNGYIDNVTLQNNSPIYTTQKFTAGKISYTRNFSKATGIGQAAGWETIVLPFTVQKIESKEKGEVTPFRNGAGSKHFWLEGLTEKGFGQASYIKANTPYIIAMPNNARYADEYNITGNVTFSAENVEVLPTATIPDVSPSGPSVLTGPKYSMCGTYEIVAQHDSVYAINDVGSAFVKDYRDIKPFEAYATAAAAYTAKTALPLFDDETTGMDGINSTTDQPAVIYDVMGIRQSAPRRGINIINGKKIITK